jgi:hypothetical protein
MKVFSTLMPQSNENKSCMRVDESWEVRVCMKVFLTLMSQSNENKSCMRVEKWEFAWKFSNSHAPVKREQELHESWEARACMKVFSTLMPRSNENRSCMRVFSTDESLTLWQRLNTQSETDPDHSSKVSSCIVTYYNLTFSVLYKLQCDACSASHLCHFSDDVIQLTFQRFIFCFQFWGLLF